MTPQVYDAAAPFDANAVPEPSPGEVRDVPATPGYEFEVAPDVPAEPQRLAALVADAEQYERVYQDGEMICTCVPAPTGPSGIHYYGPVSFERERFPYADFGQPYEPPEVTHYYGPVSFERDRYPYADFGKPFDPYAEAAAKAEVVEEPTTRGAAGVLETDKEEETALIAAIMDEPTDDKTQFAVNTSSATVMRSSNMSSVNPNSICSIICGFLVQLVVQQNLHQIYN